VTSQETCGEAIYLLVSSPVTWMCLLVDTAWDHSEQPPSQPRQSKQLQMWGTTLGSDWGNYKSVWPFVWFIKGNRVSDLH